MVIFKKFQQIVHVNLENERVVTFRIERVTKYNFIFTLPHTHGLHIRETKRVTLAA